MDKFRSISLCNSFYKIISKVVTWRLLRILPLIISPQQSGFVTDDKSLTLSLLSMKEFTHWWIWKSKDFLWSWIYQKPMTVWTADSWVRCLVLSALVLGLFRWLINLSRPLLFLLLWMGFLPPSSKLVGASGRGILYPLFSSSFWLNVWVDLLKNLFLWGFFVVSHLF